MLFHTMQSDWVCLMMADPNTPIGQLDFAKCVTSDDSVAAFKAFGDFLYDFCIGKELSKESFFSFYNHSFCPVFPIRINR